MKTQVFIQNSMMKKIITTATIVFLLVVSGVSLTGCQEEHVENSSPINITKDNQDFLNYIEANTYTGTKSEDFGKYKEVVEYVMQSRSLPIERLANIKVNAVFGDISLKGLNDAGDGLGQIILEMYKKGYDVDWVKEEYWYKEAKKMGSPYQIPDKKINNIVSYRHYRWHDKVNNHTAVEIFVNDDVPLNWRNAIKKAVQEWNSIDGGLSFKLVERYATGRIKIYMDNLGYSSTAARAEFPSGGKPGWRIRINNNHDGREVNMNIGNKRLFTMVHEIGHTIGLNHTDDEVQANSTWEISPMDMGWWCNSSTPESVMRGKMSNKDEYEGFTYCDRKAYRTLYPEGLLV